jgi:hypothetical protein
VIVEEVTGMQVEVHNCYNPDATIAVNPNELARHNVEQTEWFLKHLGELRPDLHEAYIESLQRLVGKHLSDYVQIVPDFDIPDLDLKFPFMKKSEELLTLVMRFVASILELPSDYKSSTKELEVLGLSRARAYDLLSYYRVKALVNVLGKKEGTSLFQEILSRIVSMEKDERVVPSKKRKLMFMEGERQTIESFVKREIGDFTVAFLDDHRTLYRFDRCVTHEILKDLNDPDIAYLASCYIGDIAEYNQGKRVKLRRTQTLHHGDFCDELYWDSTVHEDPEQPPLDFTRNLGRK